MSQEGVVETAGATSNPTVDSDPEDDSEPESSSESNNNEIPIESNITKKVPGTNENGEDDTAQEYKDSSSDDSDDEDSNTNKNKHSKSKPDNHNPNDIPPQNNHRQNANPNPNDNTNSNSTKYGIIFLVIAILWVYIQQKVKDNKPLPICNQIPNSSMKFKLQCPKCDAFDANGKCIIYAPLSSQEFTINAKGKLYIVNFCEYSQNYATNITHNK